VSPSSRYVSAGIGSSEDWGIGGPPIKYTVELVLLALLALLYSDLLLLLVLRAVLVLLVANIGITSTSSTTTGTTSTTRYVVSIRIILESECKNAVLPRCVLTC
jgi:hypothetical protein